MTVSAYPLTWPTGWPRSERHRQSAYRVSYAQGLDELHDELKKMGAKHIVVSSNAPCRRDGRPYTEAATEVRDDPGVAVYFTLRSSTGEWEQLVVACDAWRTVAHNIRGCGLAIRGLRMIQRTGASQLLRQAFTGFRALPDSSTAWWVVLEISPRAGEAEIRAAYRRRAKECHPDRGGSAEAMAELTAARDAGLQAARERT